MSAFIPIPSQVQSGVSQALTSQPLFPACNTERLKNFYISRLSFNYNLTVCN